VPKAPKLEQVAHALQSAVAGAGEESDIVQTTQDTDTATFLKVTAAHAARGPPLSAPEKRVTCADTQHIACIWV
jgi:hypothetical protein